MKHSICQILPGHSLVAYRVKSGNFGHRVKIGHSFANSGNPDKTAPYELILIFSVCFVNLFFYFNNQNMKQTRLLSQFT